ncbi:MAG: M23 family metallopeptidase [Bdellovibrionales bacterium]
MSSTWPRALVLLVLSALWMVAGSSCSTYPTRTHRTMSRIPTSADLADYDFSTDSAPLPTRQEFLFDWPVDRARLSRGFHVSGRRPHLGIDLAGPRGTPVFSSQGGIVIYTGRDFRGFGKMILIEAANGWATLYAHLDQILVSEGQRVRIGESIGLMGNTGRSTGPHLHFEVRRDKAPQDPLLYLPGGLEASRKLASQGR